jgi:signal transduction histidine kinase
VTSAVSIHDVVMGNTPRLEDMVDRNALGEVLDSFYALFKLPVRVFNAEGLIVADALGPGPQLICQYIDTFAAGRAACEATVDGAKHLAPPSEGSVVHPCFTGAAYRIFPIPYDGRVIGKVVLGPYLPAETAEVPRTLLQLHPEMDAGRARTALGDMPRVRAETANALVRHLRSAIDVILFSGHRALLMTQMHLASVRESYRELQDKTDELARSYEKLKELDRLKSNFLATVSHELRTPLTSIIGYSEMLTEGIGGTLTEEQRDFVTTIRERGEQLLSLITSLLDLGKLEQGSIAIAPGSVSLVSLATDIATTFMPSARRRNIQLRVQTDAKAPEARGDRERLRQVLTNLVDNALKFTPAGGAVNISVKPVTALGAGDDDDDSGLALMAPLQNDVEVRIQDSGIGIPEAVRDKVFDAFYQVDSGSTREYGGAGLGLAIVKRIVDGHGGKISIESNAGAPGTTFVVRLPAQRA